MVGICQTVAHKTEPVDAVFVTIIAVGGIRGQTMVLITLSGEMLSYL